MTRRRVLGAMLASAVAYTIGYTSGPLLAPDSTRSIQLIAGQAAATAALILVARAARIPLIGRAGASPTGPFRRILVGGTLGVAAGAAAAIASLASRTPAGVDITLDASFGVTVLALTLGAALSEELAFRHLGYRMLRHTGTHLRATLLSTLLFTAAHATRGFDPLALSTVAVAGTLLAATYRRYGYSGAVALHAAFNLIVVLSVVAFA